MLISYNKWPLRDQRLAKFKKYEFGKKSMINIKNNFLGSIINDNYDYKFFYILL